MRYGNTREVRKSINAAIKELNTGWLYQWTDPPCWSAGDSHKRIVTYHVGKSEAVAALANQKLYAAGFLNVVRVTDSNYIKVNADLA
jgi:hypothetical protein